MTCCLLLIECGDGNGDGDGGNGGGNVFLPLMAKYTGKLIGLLSPAYNQEQLYGQK